MKPNRIPAEPFRSIIAEYVTGIDVGDNPIEVLAGWAGVQYDTLEKIVLRGRWSTVDFDFADAVITNGPGANLWHMHPELSEQYQKVDLAEETYCIHGVPARRDQRRVDVCGKCAFAFARSARIRRRKQLAAA